MTTIHIQYELNNNVNFVHIVNYLVSYKLMSLDEAVDLYRRFKAMDDIVIDIPEQAADELRMELIRLHCVHE